MLSKEKRLKKIFVLTATFLILAVNSFSQKLTGQKAVKPAPKKQATSTNCQTITDSLTRKTICINADTKPYPEVGEGKFRPSLERLINPPPDSAEDFNPTVRVGFVVDSKGNISGERIMSHNNAVVGQQLLNILKTFCWLPGTCNGRKVTSFYQFSACIGVSQE